MASKAVLFDLDGTFADTAADLVRALNRLRADRGLPDLPLAELRQFASAGARGLIVAGLQMLPDHPDYTATREQFLKHYAAAICVDTQLFPGIEELLAAIEARGLRWGIVTNKSTTLTRQLLEAMRLAERPACIVCGDTTPYLKPDPASLFHAAKVLGVPPEECVYVGDDLRDMLAAHAAGMYSVAAAWGYGEALESWNADRIILHPTDLIAVL
ncbi:MAG TPA: HAD-IA family hydrolase [Burkholderiales bacterium]|nr:HAD-IA family hydrolase [Burkholderiales bacterium]